MRGPPPKQGQNALELALAKRDSTILRTVREAIRHRQVMLAFQPVVQARRQEATAFHEGLIRVLDETGRVVPAREFIETVEESEDGRILDCIALEQGLRELEREPGLRLAINMSARSIGYGDWLDTLTRGLRAGPTVAERLILEITEASAMMVPELVISFMDDLQARGVTFAMDDFGAGYTALRHFKQFSFDILKTTYTPGEATVLVDQRFDQGNFTEVRRYTYFLQRRDRIWKVIDFGVQNLGTE